MTDYDAIIIGAGHNGLICGSYLAKAGQRVLILDARDQAGGCASTREVAPGFRMSDCAQSAMQIGINGVGRTWPHVGTGNRI